MSLDRQIPGQAGVAKQDRINKANSGKLEAMIRLGITSKTKPKLRPRKIPRRASAYLNMNTASKDI